MKLNTKRQKHRLKPYDAASDDDDDSVVDEANAYAEGSVLRSQAGAGSAVDDPGGGIDDPGGGNTDDLGSFGNLATSTTTSSKTSVSFVSSPLTTGNSLLSLSDKSAVDVVGDLDVDCATGYVSVTDSVFYFLIYSSFLFFLYYLLLA